MSATKYSHEVRFVEDDGVYRIVNRATGIAEWGDYENENAAWRALDAAEFGGMLMVHPHCPTHHVPFTCPACNGAKGGSAGTDAQKQASRTNGKRGGRPPRIKPST